MVTELRKNGRPAETLDNRAPILVYCVIFTKFIYCVYVCRPIHTQPTSSKLYLAWLFVGSALNRDQRLLGYEEYPTTSQLIRLRGSDDSFEFNKMPRNHLLRYMGIWSRLLPARTTLNKSYAAAIIVYVSTLYYVYQFLIILFSLHSCLLCISPDLSLLHIPLSCDLFCM